MHHKKQLFGIDQREQNTQETMAFTWEIWGNPNQQVGQKDCSPTAPGGYMKRHVHSQKAATECHVGCHTTMMPINPSQRWHTKWHIGGRSAEWDKGSLGCEEMWGAWLVIPCLLMSPETYGFRWGWEHHCQTSEWNLNYQLLFVFCREWWNLMNIRGKWPQTRKVDQTLNIFAPDARPDNPQKPDILPKCKAFFSFGIFWIFVVGNVQSRTETQGVVSHLWTHPMIYPPVTWHWKIPYKSI